MNSIHSLTVFNAMWIYHVQCITKCTLWTLLMVHIYCIWSFIDNLVILISSNWFRLDVGRWTLMIVHFERFTNQKAECQHEIGYHRYINKVTGQVTNVSDCSK